MLSHVFILSPNSPSLSFKMELTPELNSGQALQGFKAVVKKFGLPVCNSLKAACRLPVACLSADRADRAGFRN